MKKCNQIFTQKGILLTVFVWCAENQQKSLMSKTLKMHKVIPLTACVFVETESANRDLTTVYTNDNWLLILLSHVHFGDWVTEIWHFSPLKTNNSAQLRTNYFCTFKIRVRPCPLSHLFQFDIIQYMGIFLPKNQIGKG